MLIGMSERGPDSAGFAVYRPPAAGCTVKLTLHHPDERYPWQRLRDDLATDALGPGRGRGAGEPLRARERCPG